MNDHIPLIIAKILDDFRKQATAPTPESIDEAMRQDKQADGYARREQARAMRLQLNDKTQNF